MTSRTQASARVGRSVNLGIVCGAILGLYLAAFLPDGAPRTPGITYHLPDAAPAGFEAFAGQVVDAAGGPLAGATVTMTPAAGGPTRTAVTDARGEFRVESLARGRHELTLGGTAAPAGLGVDVPSEPPVTIAAARLVSIRGRVAGVPTGPSEVELAGSAGPRTASVGPDGAFAIDVPEGRWAVGARAGLAASATVVVERFGVGPFADVVLELAPAGAVIAIARGDDGAPLAGATVRLAPVVGDGPQRTTTTDAAGRARLDGLAPGEWTIDVEAAARLPAAIVVDVTGGAETALEIVLARGAVIVGRVVDETGAPVAGAEPRWLGGAPQLAARGRFVPRGELGVLLGAVPYPPPPGALVAMAAAPALDPSAPPPLRTDTTGRFRIDALASGTARLEVRHPGRAPAWSPELVLEAGAEVDAGDLVLVPGAPVVVRVTDAGTPIAGALIELAGEVGVLTTAITDAQGRASLGRLAGTFTVSASAPGTAPARTEVEIPPAGDADVVVELEIARLGGRLEIEVEDPDGRALPGAIAAVLVGGAEASRGVAGTEGLVEVGAPDGAFALVVRAPGHVAVERPFPTPPDERLVVRLERAGLLEGDVTDAQTRNPIDNGTVRAIRLGAPGDRAGEATGRVLGGSFRLGELQAGRWRLSVRARGYATREVEVEVPPSRVSGERSATARIELSEGVVLAGQVVDAHGEPVVGMTVRAGGASGQTDDAGRFRLTGVAPGDIMIEAGLARRTLRAHAGDELTTLLLSLPR